MCASVSPIRRGAHDRGCRVDHRVLPVSPNPRPGCLSPPSGLRTVSIRASDGPPPCSGVALLPRLVDLTSGIRRAASPSRRCPTNPSTIAWWILLEDRELVVGQAFDQPHLPQRPLHVQTVENSRPARARSCSGPPGCGTAVPDVVPSEKWVSSCHVGRRGSVAPPDHLPVAGQPVQPARDVGHELGSIPAVHRQRSVGIRCAWAGCPAPAPRRCRPKR